MTPEAQAALLGAVVGALIGSVATGLVSLGLLRLQWSQEGEATRRLARLDVALRVRRVTRELIAQGRLPNVTPLQVAVQEAIELLRLHELPKDMKASLDALSKLVDDLNPRDTGRIAPITAALHAFEESIRLDRAR